MCAQYFRTICFVFGADRAAEHEIVFDRLKIDMSVCFVQLDLTLLQIIKAKKITIQ